MHHHVADASYRQSHARPGDRMGSDGRCSRPPKVRKECQGAARLAQRVSPDCSSSPVPTGKGLTGSRRPPQVGEGCGAVPVHVRLGGRIASEYGITIREPDSPQHLPLVRASRGRFWCRRRRAAPTQFPGRKTAPGGRTPWGTASHTGEEPTLRSASAVGAATLANANVLRIRCVRCVAGDAPT